MFTCLRRIHDGLIGYYFILLFFVLWQAAPTAGWADPRFVPPFSRVMQSGWELVRSGEMFIHISISLERVFAGLLLAILAGIPLGFLLGGWLPGLARFLNPLMNLCAQINTIVLLPLFIILFGVGEGGKLGVIFWASFWPILFTTMAGIRQVDPLIVKCARSMGVGGPTIFFKVILPGAALQIFAGVRTGATMAFIMLIGAEMLGANMGLGWLIRNAEENWLVPRLFLGLFAIAVIGLMINYSLEWLEKTLITWREPLPE